MRRIGLHSPHTSRQCAEKFGLSICYNYQILNCRHARCSRGRDRAQLGFAGCCNRRASITPRQRFAADEGGETGGEVIEQPPNSGGGFHVFVHGDPHLQFEIGSPWQAPAPVRRCPRDVVLAAANSYSGPQGRELRRSLSQRKPKLSRLTFCGSVPKLRNDQSSRSNPIIQCLSRFATVFGTPHAFR